MINPMLQSLNQNRIMQSIQTIKALGNPQMMLQQMPQYREIMDYVNANGGDAEKAFYAKAKEMGLDAEEIVKAMRNA